MAWNALITHGTTSDQVSAITLNLPIASNNASVGSILLVAAASDNASSGETTLHTISDSQGHTWIRVKEASGRSGAAENTGVTISLWRTTVTTALVAGVDSIALTLGSARINKVISAASFNPDAVSFSEDDAVFAVGSGNTPSVTSGTLTDAEHLLIGVMGIEYGVASLTQDADYTSIANRSTNSGAGSDAIRMIWAYRVGTLTSDTYNPTSTVGQDFAIILATFSEVTAGETVSATISDDLTLTESLSWSMPQGSDFNRPFSDALVRAGGFVGTREPEDVFPFGELLVVAVNGEAPAAGSGADSAGPNAQRDRRLRRVGAGGASR